MSTTAAVPTSGRAMERASPLLRGVRAVTGGTSGRSAEHGGPRDHPSVRHDAESFVRSYLDSWAPARFRRLRRRPGSRRDGDWRPPYGGRRPRTLVRVARANKSRYAALTAVRLLRQRLAPAERARIRASRVHGEEISRRPVD